MKKTRFGGLIMAAMGIIASCIGLFVVQEQGPPGLMFVLDALNIATPLPLLLIGAGLAAVACFAFVHAVFGGRERWRMSLRQLYRYTCERLKNLVEIALRRLPPTPQFKTSRWCSAL